MKNEIREEGYSMEIRVCGGWIYFISRFRSCGLLDDRGRQTLIKEHFHGGTSNKCVYSIGWQQLQHVICSRKGNSSFVWHLIQMFDTIRLTWIRNQGRFQRSLNNFWRSHPFVFLPLVFTRFAYFVGDFWCWAIPKMISPTFAYLFKSVATEEGWII